MELTTKVLRPYRGGQAKIEIPGTYLLRGKISSIRIHNNELVIEFAWLARNRHYPPVTSRWTHERDLHFVTRLAVCTVLEPDAKRRISLTNSDYNETVTLYLAGDEDNLDQARVE
jgi:hypothetical protein